MTSRSLHRCVSSSLIALGLVACTLDERATGTIPLPPAQQAESPVEVELDAAAEADASAAEPVLDASEPAAVDTPALPPAVRMQPPAQAEDAGAPQPPPPPPPPPPPDAGPGPVQPTVCQVDCTKFVDIATRLRLIVEDLRALDPPELRGNVRYLDLTNYANAGHGVQQLDLYREAIAYAINSLSRGPIVVLPQAIDAQGLLFRIRLSDYGWTQASWEALVAQYPYGVKYDADSRTFPIDDAALETLLAQLGTQTPYIQADWFFSHAVRPPLYYTLLGVPANLKDLEAQLGVSIADDIQSGRIARAGFQESGPSHFNRVIERHALGERGALWLTYDFDAGSGFSNIITHPLDFRHASSELLFSLANGLHGYMVVDARGARLDKAPNAAVQDMQASDSAIESGISCTNCHLETGVNVQHDELRDAVRLFGTDVQATDAILALYKDDATLDALFDTDSQRYRAALTATRLREFTDGSAHSLDDAFAGLLRARDVASVLGLEERQLLAVINSSPGVFPPEALALRVPGATLARDRFESKFAQFVGALGLGVSRRK
ncbi:MAG TPA: hypothetical protein VJV78_03870 [Polyangiales bacterium]|nr:hypothetical protein [Polyangiales bacterium]